MRGNQPDRGFSWKLFKTCSGWCELNDYHKALNDMAWFNGQEPGDGTLNTILQEVKVLEIEIFRNV